MFRGARSHSPHREFTNAKNVIRVRKGLNNIQLLSSGIPGAHFNGLRWGPLRPNCGQCRGGRVTRTPDEDSCRVFPRPKIGRKYRMLQKRSIRLHSVQSRGRGIIPQGIFRNLTQAITQPRQDLGCYAILTPIINRRGTCTSDGASISWSSLSVAEVRRLET